MSYAGNGECDQQGTIPLGGGPLPQPFNVNPKGPPEFMCSMGDRPLFFHLGGSFGHDTVGLFQVFNPVVTITKINNCPHVFECL